MTECKGLFGKLFGHQFEKYKVKEPAECYKITSENMGCETLKILTESNFIDYEIRCKRCGCKADE